MKEEARKEGKKARKIGKRTGKKGKKAEREEQGTHILQYITLDAGRGSEARGITPRLEVSLLKRDSTSVTANRPAKAAATHF